MPSLSDYIKQQLEKGYNINTIKDVLLKYGHSSIEIDETINQIYQKPKSSKKVLFLIIALIIFIPFFFFIFNTLLPVNFIVELKPETQLIHQDEQLNFDLHLTSPKKIEVELTHKVMKLGSDAILFEKKERVIIEGDASKIVNVPVENFEPGTYFIKTLINHKNNKKMAFARFNIEKKTFLPSELGEEEVEIKEEKDISIEEERGEIQKEATTQEGITKQYTLKEIIEISSTNLDEAVRLCELSTEKELCFAEIAQNTKKNQLCEKIGTAVTKDGCYANFALEGDFSVCDKITDTYQKEGCYALANQQPVEEIIEKTRKRMFTSFINHPKDNFYTNNLNPEISFTLMHESENEIEYAIYVDSINSKRGVATNNIMMNETLINLSSGKHEIKVEGMDSYGNKAASESIYVTVDLSSPIISFETVNNTVFNISPMVEFMVADDSNTTIDYTLYFDDAEYKQESITNYSTIRIDLPSINGPHVITLEAKDYAANKANASVNVIVKVAPKLSPPAKIGDSLLLLLVIIMFLFCIFVVFYKKND